MNVVAGQTESAGFTRRDLLFLVIAITFLSMLAFPSMIRAKRRAQRISCTSYLKQISLGAKQWALDNTNAFPMSLSTIRGGTKEWIATGDTFRHFEVMSNELATPYVLVCPSDTGRRRLRTFLPTLNNSNLSYFVGIEARDDAPQMFLFGDRNIWRGVRPANGVVGLTTNNFNGWGPGLHNGQGNVALADGSVQAFSPSGLREALGNTGAVTNWLQLP